MKKLDYRYIILIFLLVNLVQGIITPITEDEAYYWMYAGNLAWGYFDHPPAVAVMIWIGKHLFQGTLGVRIITNILSVLTYIILWFAVSPEDRKREGSLFYFALLVAVIPICNIYGFITTPDVPLLFFSALYLVVFRKFIKKTNFNNAVYLGLVSALLMYSKYHGILLIFFSLLPYLRLLKNKNFYIFALTGVVCYIPHLAWQYNHEFISVKYHLFYRSENEFLIENIIQYILNTFFVLNPFFLGLLIYQTIRKKVLSGDRKEWLFIFWGAILFFGLSAFRDHVEPQWITFAVLPLILMLHRQIIRQNNLEKYTRQTAFISIAIILGARVLIVLHEPLNPLAGKEGRAYFEAVDSIAGDDKVAYINSYPKAAKHTYYTGHEAFSYDCVPYGKKQYDFWPYEKTYQGADVFLVGSWPSYYLDTVYMKNGTALLCKRVKDFQVLSRVEARFIELDLEIKNGKVHPFSILVKNPYDYSLNFNKGKMKISLTMFLFAGHTDYHILLNVDDPEDIPPKSEMLYHGSFKVDVPTGKYKAGIALQPGYLTAVPVSPRRKVWIK